MNIWESHRFGKRIHLTYHALRRMEERRISLDMVQDLIEKGTLIHKDEKYCWIFKSYSHRDDNLVCAAVIRGSAVVIKTLMTHWQEQPE
ncbi:DUF4258 domain-containing protein [Candidatus Thiosymbion oneisti]|uniref:DUF4258 domain-containing protein n=1 Tax=Candidatus Thiosymbion oneisti TaxID=589554 RepID=UPI000B802AFE|nr:DUF4258 domain-containing protein [Candidatus Thiosymbion oneisti]